jgi:uroporphyrinogen decarboxylase
MDTRLLDALAGRNRSRPPVWLMRQAGRYMPEFRAIRKKYSFMEVCRNPELAAEVTRLPIDMFGMDAAILFSDILVILEALHIPFHFQESVGPVIDRPIRSLQELQQLPPWDVENTLQYVADAIKLLRADLQVPLLGFCGAPFTIASYVIEGGQSKDLLRTKRWMFNDPVGFHQLLQTITDATLAYLKLQIKAGVHAIQIFDTWAMHLARSQFLQFSCPYQQQLVDLVKSSHLPVILYCRGSSVFAQDMAALKPSCVSVDWQADLRDVSQVLPEGIALQGNLDPDLLYAPLPTLKNEINCLLDTMRGHHGYVFNLGHGIKPDVPVEAVRCLVDTVQAR